LSKTRVALCSGLLGLAISGTILVLLYFGVSGILVVGPKIDLMYLLWPSSIFLLITWRTTMQGILLTALLVALNFGLYATVALLLRYALHLICRRSEVK
jgi:hypothetical protein